MIAARTALAEITLLTRQALCAILAVATILAITQRKHGAIDRSDALGDGHAQFRNRSTAFRGEQLTITLRLPLFLGEYFAKRLAEGLSQSVGLLGLQRRGCF
jgi:hypothetical protein